MKKQLLFLVMMMLPLVASAHDIEVKNADDVTIYYNYINDGAELAVTFRGEKFDSYSNEYSGNVVIPEEVTYMDRTRKVTSIGEYAFGYCTSLTSITIPSSVAIFEDHALAGCSGLTSIIIPNGVTKIGNAAFHGCTGLTSITIPNSVTSISSVAFSGCTGLTSITIPQSVTKIGSGAFNYCRLEKLMIYNVNAKFSEAFSNKTLQHAMLYIPEGTWSDAIYEGDCYLFNNIREVATSTQSLSPSITYNLINTESFGYAVYDETTNKIKMAKAFYSIDENDANNCWQVQSQSGKNYLYNLGAQKYASVSVDGNITLSAYPVEITITEGENGLILGADTNHRWGFVKSQGQSNPTSINTNIHYDTTDRIYYSLDGQQFKAPQKGINIVRYKDGSTKKVIIK